MMCASFQVSFFGGFRTSVLCISSSHFLFGCTTILSTTYSSEFLSSSKDGWTSISVKLLARVAASNIRCASEARFTLSIETLLRSLLTSIVTTCLCILMNPSHQCEDPMTKRSSRKEAQFQVGNDSAFLRQASSMELLSATRLSHSSKPEVWPGRSSCQL